MDTTVTTVFELDALLRQKMPLLLLDVREPDEFTLCHIEGARSAPLLDVPDLVDSLDPAEQIVVCCHTGNKSQEVVKYLRHRGFQRVSNLEGGIDLWALAIDRSFPIFGREPERSGRLKLAFWEKVAAQDKRPSAPATGII